MPENVIISTDPAADAPATGGPAPAAADPAIASPASADPATDAPARPAKQQKDHSLLLFTVALFVFITAVHILCGDYPKNLDVLPDERRYLEIARSLFASGDLVIRGASSNFQKILYPVSLFPALLFPDGADQIRMVNVLNSVYACSSVFPALLIARRVFRDRRAIVACLVLVAITPDLMFSMTFMSESVFMPLSLWLLFACWRCFESDGWRERVLAVVCGALCYVVYLCKEVAWAYLIAFALFYLLAAVRKRTPWQRAVTAVALFAAAFFALFVAFKLTLFAGLSNSYSQFGPEPLISQYARLFGLHALALESVYFIVGFGVFPVVYLAITYRDTPRHLRDLLFLCFTVLVVGLLVVVFTISMREDVGHVALRPHLRYVAPIAMVLIMLFIKQVANFDAAAITDNPRRSAVAAGVTVGFCVLVATFFGVGNLVQGFDYAQFHFMRWLLRLAAPLAPEYFDSAQQTLTAIATDDGALLEIDPVNWLCRAAVIAFTLVGMYFLLHRNPEWRLRAGAAICAVIAAFMVANSVTMYLYNKGAYECEAEDQALICDMSDLLAAVQDKPVVVLLDDTNTKSNDLVDTYLQDGRGYYHYLLVKEFSDKFEATKLAQGIQGYLLVNSDHNVADEIEGHSPVVVAGGEGERFTLYQLN